MRQTAEDKTKAIEYATKLREWCPIGSTVYTVLRHVSRSGMSRRIDMYAMDPNGGRPLFLTGYAAAVMGERWDHDGGGIVVAGCGMDMGFHLVNNLGHALWPDGVVCPGEEKCPIPGNGIYGPHRGNLGYCGQHGKHSGGYALRHEWI